MNVAITGGTGTLGRALIPRLLALGDPRVVSVSRDEVKAGEIHDLFEHPNLRVFLGDIRDPQRLVQAFQGIDTVIHAAALKRVTESVYSPSEVIKTNVQGTINVIQAAQEAGCSRVLFISSDKAVHATNLYGSTKFTAECYAVQANSYTYPRGLRVSCTRYGNVLGSRGSVTEVWRDTPRDQPLTVTDPEMTRFMITQEQAVGFILASLDRMEGGEVFIPYLSAYSIGDLAQALHHGRAIEYVGLRPGGEKLHERLVSDEEYGRLYWGGDETRGGFIIRPSFAPWTDHRADETMKVNLTEHWPFSSDTADRIDVKGLREICRNHLS